MLQKQIDNKLKKIYEKYKEDKEDLTGWSFERKLKEEADSNEDLFDYFCCRVMKIAYNMGEIPLLFLSDLILYPHFEERHIIHPSEMELKNKTLLEFLPKIFFKRGIKTKVLEAIGFNKTIKAYYSYLLCIQEEFDGKSYLEEKEISKFSNWESASNELANILREELGQKFGEEFGNRPRIFKFK